jgi:HlyD family secretion protein
MKPLYRRVCLSIVIATVAVALPGCRGQPSGGASESMSATATVQRGTIAKTVNLSGQLSALASRELRFETVSGRVEQILVERGQMVAQGDPLLRLDTSELAREMREAEADLAVAQAQMDAAQQTVSPAAVALAQAELATSQYQLRAAKLQLDLAATEGLIPLEQNVKDKAFALEQARTGLSREELTANQIQIREFEYQQAFFQRALRDVENGKDPAELQRALESAERNLVKARAAREKALAQAQEVIEKAEEELSTAELRLDRARAGQFDPLAEHRLAYERALEARDKSQEHLDELATGTDSDAVEQAKVSLEAALAKVDSIRSRIEASTLKAPIQGVVFDVYVLPDSWVESSTVVAYLQDPSELRVKAQATDVDVVHLNVGQEARVSFAVDPNRPISAKVVSVAERGQSMEGLVSYEVEVLLEDTELEVLQGMMATVRVLLGAREDALIVPASAIQYNWSGEPRVAVQTAEGEWEDQPVQIGLDDGTSVEILSGLVEGQVVQVPLFSPWSPDQAAPPMVPTAVVVEEPVSEQMPSGEE